ncbi:hypothetical protein AA14337_1579 [Acetobacter malorum DSM 14337]|uniref:ATP-binding protein n=1 Tax=Acetobacter malorum DSM 14337 TaxID=1307910 RepID=A0ABQ0PSP2_9PROT|nr:hypothetical protein [Acetobacter malorum]GBQ79938.1 hypothetical protein AA14337_1579 [Acetobacter malorum DSM 14337]
MKALRELKKWFPTGTAEGERAILEEAFIYIDEFDEVIEPPRGSPHLLIGRKGSGKTAVIDFSETVIERHGIPVIKLSPTDIDTSIITDDSSTGEMNKIFLDALILSICKKLSEKSIGWFDSDFYTMYSAAVEAGVRSPDIWGRVGKFFSSIAKGPTKIDLNSSFPHLTSATRSEIGGAVERALQGETVHIFIDDTDQVSNPDKPGHLNRIWSLLLAVRLLAEKIPQIKAVISLRTEVWERLKRDQAGQRDQTDHFSSLVVEMPGGNEHVEEIILRRLQLAAGRLAIAGDPYNPFFEGSAARAPGSNEARSWKHLLSVRSRGRPRDTIQLINALAKRAIQAKAPKITEKHFRDEMPGFSKKIVEQFAVETSGECPTAVEILRTFTRNAFNDSGYSMTSEHAFQHCLTLLTRFGITLYGIPLKHNDVAAFQIWSFLYISGVLSARASDSRTKNGFRHLDPMQDLTLVSKSRWNDLQKLMWELNTVYRDYMTNISDDIEASIGLAVKVKARESKRIRKK